MNDRAIIMLVHGSRDPAWNKPFIDLKEDVSRLVPETVVVVACLQFGAPSLDEAVSQLAAMGIKAAVVVPVFLSSLGHVTKDIPVLLETVGGKYPGIRLTVSKAVGEYADVRNAIAGAIAGAGAA